MAWPSIGRTTHFKPVGRAADCWVAYAHVCDRARVGSVFRSTWESTCYDTRPAANRWQQWCLPPGQRRYASHRVRGRRFRASRGLVYRRRNGRFGGRPRDSRHEHAFGVCRRCDRFKAVRIAAVSASDTTNMPGAWEGGSGSASGISVTLRLQMSAGCQQASPRRGGLPSHSHVRHFKLQARIFLVEAEATRADARSSRRLSRMQH